MTRVAILGGGIAGLAAAHALREGAPEIGVEVLEAGSRAGGLLETARVGEFVVELGPDAILAEKPAAVELAKKLGMEREIVRTRPENRGAYVVARGALERIPDGFSLLAPTRIAPFLASPILSARGKARALLEVFVRRGPARDDESLGDFVERRFGRELLDRLAQPLASGIYGADPAELGLAATMPRFLEAERERGSVIRALRARSGDRGAGGARYGLFVGFRDGMATLPDALSAALSGCVSTGARVVELARIQGRFVIRTADGRVRQVDGVIVALPGPVAGPLLTGLDRALGALVSEIAHGSTATVTFGLRASAFPKRLDASGFVVPAIERSPVLAATFASAKWEGRAPVGRELVRVFLGGPGRDAIVEEPDDVLVALAEGALESLLGMRGRPLFARVVRYRDAMPRYRVGHLAHVGRIEERAARLPGLELAGKSYRGAGIPDAIRSGQRAAERLVASLGRPSVRPREARLDP